MKLNSIFNPQTVAIIGATDRIGSVGRGLVKNLLDNGRSRKIYLINPNRNKVFGIKTFSEIQSVDKKIDLAVIAVPAKIVFKIVKQCCEKKVKGIIIISSGFAEIGTDGALLQSKVIGLTNRANIALVGPNCLGVLRPSTGLNASFAPLSPNNGAISLISQSGALLDSVIDASADKSYGFSTVLSYGNEAGITLPNFLDWAGKDKKTKVISLYFEGLKNGREFFNVAKEVSKTKPIIVLKGGKTKTAQKAVSSHTGSLAGAAEIYSAAFKQAGLIEVNSLQELLDVSKALVWQPKCKNGIGIITNGGGAGILATDYCHQLGIKLTKLDSITREKINKSKEMHPGWSKNNPIDVVGDALSNRYKIAIDALIKQKDVNGLMIIQTMQVMTEPIKNAKIIINAKKRYPNKPIVTVFMGGKLTNPSINLLEKNKIPNYSDPMRAAHAFKALINNN
ncbi:MAG: CoA-binding protein [Patescibacteria group bacterium]|nr:CoA-binding protein [Patescibacteria group bacterium]